HAASPGEFARQVRAAVLEADGETRERRMSIARGETWDERAKGIVEHIGLHLRPQRGNPS
ncbi:MAG: hypothetical protein NTY38_04250, partial [Acidobacteria bacterium]|nr:hypothetical protein [Acidobacteriota bacterium]